MDSEYVCSSVSSVDAAWLWSDMNLTSRLGEYPLSTSCLISSPAGLHDGLARGGPMVPLQFRSKSFHEELL